MKKLFDVIVLGLGANGSAAVYHLAKTGANVAGIDQFVPPHSKGSSHGKTRIIRQAYYEHPSYVPLVKEAYKEWGALEKTSGKQLLLKTGGIMLGHSESELVKGSKLSADLHNIDTEFLNSNEVGERFPAFKPSTDTSGLLEKEAGILFPELCISTMLEQASANGATLIYDQRVISIQQESGRIKIVTEKEEFYALKLIVTVGAWLNELLPELQLPLTIERQVLFWIKDRQDKNKEVFSPANLPIYIWEFEPGKMFYGFPDTGDGIKIAFHHIGETITPATFNPEVYPAEIEHILDIARTYLDIDPVLVETDTCMYTNTPDQHFIIDYHPQNRNIIIGSPCSGHGFKFSVYTGKILADLALKMRTDADISLFGISGFRP